MAAISGCTEQMVKEVKPSVKEVNDVLAVQTLNAIMMKKGIRVTYELLYDGGQKGDGVFVCQVVCGNDALSASGNSKKNAKRNVAVMMLNQVRQNDEKILAHIEEKSKPQEWWAGMPINTLHVICNRADLPHPEYQAASRTGPIHAPMFITQCTVSPYTRKGEGRTKKLSKQNAAKNMIILLSLSRESVKQIIEQLGSLTKSANGGNQSDVWNGNVTKTDSIDFSIDSSNSSNSPDNLLHSSTFEKCEGKIVTPKIETHSQCNVNVNGSINGITSEVISESSSPPIQQKLNWPPGYLTCQRRYVVKKLLNLSIALKQPNVKQTNDFACNIYNEFKNILKLLDAVPEQIIQCTHDGKYMLAIYLPTDPMIIDVAVDVDEVNLKIVLYRRVVKTLLDMI